MFDDHSCFSVFDCGNVAGNCLQCSEKIKQRIKYSGMTFQSERTSGSGLWIKERRRCCFYLSVSIQELLPFFLFVSKSKAFLYRFNAINRNIIYEDHRALR